VAEERIAMTMIVDDLRQRVKELDDKIERLGGRL